jgi:Putative prokaryotic signal transducing protein
MSLRNPTAVWTAPSNAEAQLICELLAEAGIEAFAVEDNSPGGMYSLGVISQIHKPQVWVDRPQVDEARRLIAKYEQQPGIRLEKPKGEFCYKCGEAVQRGTVKCPACGEMLDWSEEASAPSTLDALRAVKKPFAWLLLVPFLIAACVMVLGLFAAICSGTF